MPGAAWAFALAAALSAMTVWSTVHAQPTLAWANATSPTDHLNAVLFMGAILIFAAVVGVIAAALFGPVKLRNVLARPTLIVLAGIAFPVVTLTVLLGYAFSTTSSLSQVVPAARVEVVGEQWWWRVRYLDESGALLFETANEIRIPSRLPVDLILTSDNVIHSFWVPALTGKLDMIPGHTNRMRLQAPEPGVYAGQCAEFCGAQHAKMRFTVQALPPDQFYDWAARQRQPARAVEPDLQRGERLFQQACMQCHTVRGTPANGTSGPDLTHVGSRWTLAAGVLPNNVGAMAGWIAGSQHLKPGNHMPSFDQWSGVQLREVARYVDSLQ